jgi:hypothetical protein
MTRTEYYGQIRKDLRNSETPWCSFANHEATVTRYDDDHYVIDWRNSDGSNAYYVRYIFDGPALMIRGDLGDAMFERYGGEPAREWLGAMRDLSYIWSKLRCSSEKYELADEIFETDLAEWIAENKPSNEVVHEIRTLMSDYDGEFVDNVFYSEFLLGEYDMSELEEISEFGKTYPARLVMWLEGLKQALRAVR